jgi:threonine/homoserine/homoserine lactone efflux protein
MSFRRRHSCRACTTRTLRTQHNSVFMAVYAVLKLGCPKMTQKLNHFAILRPALCRGATAGLHARLHSPAVRRAPLYLTLPRKTLMTHLLPPGHSLMAFLLASLILAVTPGPGVLYIVTRSLTQGRRAGLASVAGVALGNLGNAAGAAIGLATLFAASSTGFAIVKYAGALYLVYLGIRALREPRTNTGAETLEAAPGRRVFREGFIIALLNPKTAMFFAAFLPQFMSAQIPYLAQSLALGSLFVAMAAATDAAYAVAASALAPVLTSGCEPRALGRYVRGGVLIGLGLFAAFTGSRTRGSG